MKTLSIFLLSVVAFAQLQAQSALNAKSPEELRKMLRDILVVNAKGDTVAADTDPLPYGYIEPSDILWSRVVWEIIDLNEKVNQPYYHSSDGIVNNTLSLFDALKKGIQDGKITEVYDDEYFKYKITGNEAVNAMMRTDTTDYYYEQKEAGVNVDNIEDNGVDQYEVRSEQVKLVKVKGMWYIDKRIGEMRYRILGLAMMGPDAQSLGRGFEGSDDYVDLFWVWYPDARKVLNSYTIFNPNNGASKITYDDMLNAHRFNSIIYKANDMVQNKSIEEYLPKDARAQLDESNRIKNNILEHENDMWNY